MVHWKLPGPGSGSTGNERAGTISHREAREGTDEAGAGGFDGRGVVNGGTRLFLGKPGLSRAMRASTSPAPSRPRAPKRSRNRCGGAVTLTMTAGWKRLQASWTTWRDTLTATVRPFPDPRPGSEEHRSSGRVPPMERKPPLLPRGCKLPRRHALVGLRIVAAGSGDETARKADT